jgi:hypothetical protein
VLSRRASASSFCVMGSALHSVEAVMVTVEAPLGTVRPSVALFAMGLWNVRRNFLLWSAEFLVELVDVDRQLQAPSQAQASSFSRVSFFQVSSTFITVSMVCFGPIF